jgi:hypothetical protein
VGTVDIMDNVGFGLTRENVERFDKTLMEDEREARMRGKYRHLSGLIYKSFDPAKHVIEPFKIPKHWPRIRLIDPHPRVPHMVTWMCRNPREELIVYDEHFEHCSIAALSVKIREKTGNDRIIMTPTDPSAFVESPLEKGKTWADEFLENGVPVTPATKQLTLGSMKVNEALEGTQGYPHLYFFRTCTRNIYEIQRYRWQEWKGTSASEKTDRQSPVDKDDHAMENLYRGVLMMPEYYDVNESFEALSYPPSDV